jgi:3-phenylpropionate/trans-cinnamate dioxygenase ferredoxin subunit
VTERVGFPKDELPAGGRKLVHIGKREIAAFNVDGRLYAVFNRCPHHRAPLVGGVVGSTNLPSGVGSFRRSERASTLKCPWHQYEFDLETGRCLASERLRVAVYEIREEGDEIAIYL